MKRIVTEFFKDTAHMTAVSVGSVAIGVGVTHAAIAANNLAAQAIEQLPVPDHDTALELLTRQNG